MNTRLCFLYVTEIETLVRESIEHAEYRTIIVYEIAECYILYWLRLLLSKDSSMTVRDGSLA